METILELTNSVSAYGSLRKAFEKDKKSNHVFGCNEDFDFQIETINDFTRESVIRKDIKLVTKIRIWMSSLNTNDNIFTAYVCALFDYVSFISIIDISEDVDKPKSFHASVANFASNELIEMQKHERKMTEKHTHFYTMLIHYYLNRNKNDNSFIMVKGQSIKELKHETIKRYILRRMPNFKKPSHIIGTVMSYEWDDKQWWFADNVIYKFIIDLINEGRIKVDPTYHGRYWEPMILYKEVM